MSQAQQQTKVAKLNFKQHVKKNRATFLDDRSNMISQIIGSGIPNWGSIKVSLFKY